MVLRKPHYEGMRSMETVWFYNTKVDSELERRKGLPKVKKPMRMLTPVRVLEPNTPILLPSYIALGKLVNLLLFGKQVFKSTIGEIMATTTVFGPIVYKVSTYS